MKSLATMNFVATNTQWKSWYTARILCFNKSFIRNCTNSTGILNLGEENDAKVIHLDFRSRSRIKYPTPTPSVVRNQTPPKSLRFVGPPQP